MNLIRVFWVVVVASGLLACGRGPSDAPAGADVSAQEPQPTAVFSDDFETGEPEEWEAVGGESKAAEPEDQATPPAE